MEMIVHEAEGMDLPAGFGARLPEGGEEAVAVFVIEEDGLPPIPAIQDMVDGALVFDAQFAGHAVTLRQEVFIVKNRPLYRIRERRRVEVVSQCARRLLP